MILQGCRMLHLKRVLDITVYSSLAPIKHASYVGLSIRISLEITPCIYGNESKTLSYLKTTISKNQGNIWPLIKKGTESWKITNKTLRTVPTCWACISKNWKTWSSAPSWWDNSPCFRRVRSAIRSSDSARFHSSMNCSATTPWYAAITPCHVTGHSALLASTHSGGSSVNRNNLIFQT